MIDNVFTIWIEHGCKPMKIWRKSHWAWGNYSVVKAVKLRNPSANGNIYGSSYGYTVYRDGTVVADIPNDGCGGWEFICLLEDKKK